MKFKKKMATIMAAVAIMTTMANTVDAHAGRIVPSGTTPIPLKSGPSIYSSGVGSTNLYYDIGFSTVTEGPGVQTYSYYDQGSRWLNAYSIYNGTWYKIDGYNHYSN